MDYLPATEYENPNFYYSDFDNAIRSAAFRGVKVRLLISKWNHTNPEMKQYLRSLNDISNVIVKNFIIPDMKGRPPVPFTRVNHTKYMVTEKLVYIGTNNWTGDYFLFTGGISYNIAGNLELITQIQSIFDRDWNSQYAFNL